MTARHLRQSWEQAWKLPHPVRGALLDSVEEQAKASAQDAYDLAVQAIAAYDLGHVGEALDLLTQAASAGYEAQVAAFDWLL